MIHRLLSKFIDLKTDVSTDANTSAIQNCRGSQNRDKERQDFLLFLTATEVGRLLAVEDPSLLKLYHDCADPLAENRLGDCDLIIDQPFFSQCEAILYQYCKPSQRDCRDPQTSGPTQSSYARSSCESHFTDNRVACGTSAANVVPGLIKILLHRWRLTLRKSIKYEDLFHDFESHTRKASQSVALNSFRLQFSHYLRVIVPCWNALLASNATLYGPILLQFGIECCVVDTLSTLLNILVHSEESLQEGAIDADDSDEALAFSKFPNQDTLYLIDLLLDLLLQLYLKRFSLNPELLSEVCVRAAGGAQCRVTPLSNSELAQGRPAFYLRNESIVNGTQFDSCFSLDSGKSEVRVGASVILWDLVVLLTHISKLSVGMLKSSPSTLSESDTPFRINCKIFLILCALPPFSMLKSAIDKLDDVRQVVNTGMESMTALLTELISMHSEDRRTTDVQSGGMSDVLSFRTTKLFQLLTCSVLLATHWLDELPVLVLQALGNLGFTQNLCIMLQLVGMNFTNTSHVRNEQEREFADDEGVQKDRIAAQLKEFVSLQSLHSDALAHQEDMMPMLVSPEFQYHPVTKANVVDEFLYCYLGLFAAQRRVRRCLSETQDIFSLNILKQLRLTVLKIFTNSDLKLESTSTGHGVDRVHHCDVDVSNKHNCETYDGNAENLLDGSRTSPIKVDHKSSKEGNSALQKLLTGKLCDGSCLYDLLAQQTLGLLGGTCHFSNPSSASHESQDKGRTTYTDQDSSHIQCLDLDFRAHDFQELVDAGLYQVFFLDDRFFEAWRNTPRLSYVVLYTLQHALTVTRNHRTLTAGRVREQSFGTALQVPFSPLTDVDCSHEAMIVLNVFCENLNALPDFKQRKRCVVGSDKAFLTISAQHTVFLCGICAVLVHALRGPRGDALQFALMSHMGFPLMTSVAVELHKSQTLQTLSKLYKPTNTTTFEEDNKQVCLAKMFPSYILIRQWTVHVLLQLTQGESAEATILSKHLSEVFLLLSAEGLTRVGEEIIIRLLCHSSSTLKCKMVIEDGNVGYAETLEPFISMIWDVIGQSQDPGDDFPIDHQRNSHLKANNQEEIIDTHNIATEFYCEPSQYLPTNLNNVTNKMTVSILECLQRALCRLCHGPFDSSLNRVRTLQNALCRQTTHKHCFLKLFHCMSRLGFDPTIRDKGARLVLKTLTSLIAGSPALRAQLFSVITPGELVHCFCNTSFDAGVDDSMNIIEAFLAFIYEDLDHVKEVTPCLCEFSRGMGAEDSVHSAQLRCLNYRDSACLEAKYQRSTIQNEVVLISLLEWLREIIAKSLSVNAGASSEKIKMLDTLLKVLHSCFLHCRVSRFLCARAGLFAALGQLLLPLIDFLNYSSEDSHVRLGEFTVNNLTSLMKISAIEHVDIKHVKRLLLIIVSSSNTRQREKLVPLVISILSMAATAFFDQEVQPRNYIAFRRNSGLSGIKVMIQDHPTHGYSICMWICIQKETVDSGLQEAHARKAVFSLQNLNGRTLLQLSVSPTTGSLSLIYLHSRGNTVEVNVGVSVPLASWFHLTFVHRPHSSLLRKDENRNATIFHSAEELPTQLSIPYPNMTHEGYFFVGTNGESAEQLSREYCLVAHVSAVLFFARPLQHTEIRQLCEWTFSSDYGTPSATATETNDVQTVAGMSASLAQRQFSRFGYPYAPFTSAPWALSPPRSDMTGRKLGLIGESGTSSEKSLTLHLIVCIDARFNERGKLYNFASLLRGRPSQNQVLIFEATLICSSTSVIDALYALGAIYTVVMPLFILLSNPQLPFGEECLFPTPHGTQKTIPEPLQTTSPETVRVCSDAVRNILRLIYVLVRNSSLRVQMADSGSFFLIANILQQLGPRLDATIPERILLLCVEQLLPFHVLFEAAYTAFFLSSDLFHACSYTTQLIWINCQRIYASINAEVRSRIRALGAQLFVVSEIASLVSHGGNTARCANGQGKGNMAQGQGSLAFTVTSLCDGKSLYEELFRFFETLTVDPITMADAIAIINLTSILYQNYQQLPKDELCGALCRIRIILFTCDPLLCQFLGRENYIVVLSRFLQCRMVCAAARREILLQLILLLSRSKYTQKYMNPILLITKNAEHRSQDISLVWLKEHLSSEPMDIALYLVLRSAMLGDFGAAVESSSNYTPLESVSPIEIPAVLELILLLIQTSYDSFLKSCVLNDLVFCLKHEPKMWQKLISIQGWHVLITDIYQFERKGVISDAKLSDSGHKCEKDDSHALSSFSRVALPSTPTRSDGFLMMCSFTLSFTLSQALMNVSYAVSEQELVVAYLQEQSLHVFLNHVLCGMVYYLQRNFYAQANTSASMFSDSSLMCRNLTAFVYTVENVLFYSARRATFFQHASVSSRSCDVDSNDLLRNTGNSPYNEWNELVIVVTERCATWTECSDSIIFRGNSLTSDPPVDLAEEDVQYAGETHFASTEGRRDLFSSPDGRWLHMDLSLKVAYLITSSETIFNICCTDAAPGSKELSRANCVACRPGGFLRLLERLLRVSSSMMLHSTGSIEALLKILDRFASLASAVPTGFLSLIRSKTLDENTNHCLLTTFMSILYCINNLLLRRLRRADRDPITRYNYINVGLIQHFKHLFIRFKSFFEKMPIFTSQSDTSFDSRRRGEITIPRTRKRTLQWLCDYSSQTANSLIDEFLEVSSRVDYTVFLKRCSLAMERNRGEAKIILDAFLTEQDQVVSRLGEMFCTIRSNQKVVLESVESLLKAHMTKTDGTGSTLLNSSNTSEVLQTSAFSSFAVDVTFFLDHVKNTIWCPEPEASNISPRYVRLSLAEQQPLRRCKIILDRNGTNHLSVSELSRNKSQSPLTGPLRSDNDRTFGRAYFGLRGCKEPLCAQSSPEQERDKFGRDGGVNPETEPDGFWPCGVSTPTEHSQMGSTPTTFGSVFPENELRIGADTNISPLVLSIPCEMPYMMHCWSAMLVIRDMLVSVIIDSENKAYNQKISADALTFLIRPKSFNLNVGMIAQVAPGRRFRMRRTALEIWLHNRRSCLLNFPDVGTMRLVLREIIQKVHMTHRLRDPRRVLPIRSFHVFQENPLKEPLLMRSFERWQSYGISNFDYLMRINLLAGRSVNDITQYPIFPWVLADYTSKTIDLENPETFRDLSKPIGACGSEERHERIKQLYEEMKEMGDVPSHYLTHYSSAAVVVYYLMRLEPFTTMYILLQGGRFDHPDRMFHAMSASFRGVITNMQDTRELIPELFYLPELCINHNGVFFGRKQDGELLGDLVLPPWADKSPHTFIYRMREALECDYVSSTLHHWIDLMFGVQQRGREAIKALNVFRWHSYEDCGFKHSSKATPDQLFDMLDNVGQTPIQLFRQSHPARRPRDLLEPLDSQNSLKTILLRWERPKRVVLISFSLVGNVIVVNGSGATIMLRLTISSLKHDALLKAHHRLSTGNHSLFPPLTLSASTNDSLLTSPEFNSGRRNSFPFLSTLHEPLPRRQACDGNETLTQSSSSWVLPEYESAYRFSFDVNQDSEWHTMRAPWSVLPDELETSEGPCTRKNSVLLCFDKESFVALGGLSDHSVRIRHLTKSVDDIYLRAHRGPVIRLAASGDSHYLVTGSEDTTFAVWTCHLPKAQRQLEVQLLFTIHRHEDLPTAVHLSSTLDIVATASLDGVLMLHSLSTASVERSLRHPQQYPIDDVLVQPTCYLPNVLFYSEVDYVVHQMSINGTTLRSFSAPGRLLCWSTTPEQYILMHCVPFNRMETSVAHSTDSRAENSRMSIASILYVHSFFLKVLRIVPLPMDTTVSTIACHPNNPQVVILGDMKGNIILVRTCAAKS